MSAARPAAGRAHAGSGAQQANRYATLLSAVADGAVDAGLPAVAVSNLCSDVHPDYARTAAEKSVPSLRGTSEGIAAIGHVLRWRDGAISDERSPRPRDPDAAQKALAALERMQSGPILDEHEAKSVLAAYGLPTLREAVVTSAEAAAAAALDFSGPWSSRRSCRASPTSPSTGWYASTCALPRTRRPQHVSCSPRQKRSPRQVYRVSSCSRWSRALPSCWSVLPHLTMLPRRGRYGGI